jgi:hypothetical protein
MNCAPALPFDPAAAAAAAAPPLSPSPPPPKAPLLPRRNAGFGLRVFNVPSGLTLMHPVTTT